MDAKNVIGLYLDGDNLKAIESTFDHVNADETIDIESALLSLHSHGKKEFCAIYAQNRNDKYVGITTVETGRNNKGFLSPGFEKYFSNYSAGYTNEMAVAEIKKLLK